MKLGIHIKKLEDPNLDKWQMFIDLCNARNKIIRDKEMQKGIYLNSYYKITKEDKS